jgi:transmembrane sensor
MESSKQTEEKAAEWLSQRDSDTWTASDQTALDHWLNESTANTIAYLRLEAAWKRAERLKALGAGFPRATVPTPEEFNLSLIVSQAGAHQKPEFVARPDSGTLKTRAPNVRALAASLLFALVSATAWYIWPTGPDFQTAVGATATVPLTDGSRVTLNTDCAIRVAVTQNERRVELDQGEAYFEVAHDPNRPFIVSAGSKRVVAVGTRFSVQRAGNSLRVVVTEGTVRLEEAQATRFRHEVATGGGPGTTGQEREGSGELFLRAGSVASTDGDGVLVQDKPLPEVEESLSWRNGYLIFHEITLAGAVAEFNRYNIRKIVIADPAVGSITLSGKFRTIDFAAFVRLLEGGFPIRAQQTERAIILTSSATM